MKYEVMRLWAKRAITYILLATTSIGTASSSLAQQPPEGMQAQEVGVVKLERQPVPRTFNLPGRAVAYEQVGIRPRVDGVVTEVLYTPGTPLKVGDPMFQLDDATYIANVASKNADLVQAEADLPVKQAAYDRAIKLEGSGYTKAEVESAEADLASSKATLDAARAALEYAQTQLSWTKIVSPIQGYAEVSDVSVGDLVSSGQDSAMTTVTRLNPVYVDMRETSSRILEIWQIVDDGIISKTDDLSADIILENGETYTVNGSMVAPSATVSTSTGTVSMRFQFENPERKIMPGMFVRGTLQIGEMKAFLVPQRAAERNAKGELTVYIVDNNNKAKQLTLEEQGTYRNNWIVVDGLDEGQWLIVDGLKNMAAGTQVTPVEAVIDDEGLIKDNETAAEPEASDASASSEKLKD